MSQAKFVYVIYIRTTLDALWEALTGAEFTRQYLAGGRFQTDWKEGSPVAFVGERGEVAWDGTVLAYDPPRRLVCAFHDRLIDAGEPHSRLTYELEPNGPTVKLTLTHEGFPPSSKVRAGVTAAWPGVLSSLKSLLEGGRPLEFDRFCGA